MTQESEIRYSLLASPKHVLLLNFKMKTFETALHKKQDPFEKDSFFQLR